MIKMLMLIGLTLLSGIASGLVFSLPEGSVSDHGLLADFGPGLFFGSAGAVYLLSQHHARGVRVLIWVLSSAAIWYLAYFTAVSGGLGIGFGVPGALGASLLAVTFNFLISRIGGLRIIFTTAVGIGLGYVVQSILFSSTLLPNPLSPSGGGLPFSTGQFILSFVVWQVGVALTLFPERLLPRR